MSLHDDYARVTPFELLFVQPDRADKLWARVAEESAGRGADVNDPHAFVTMGVVTDFIRTVEGEDAPPASTLQYGALAFHALHFAKAGRPLYLLGTHACRYLAEGPGGTEPEPPEPAGYLQLPQHLFWMDDGGGVPQSVDGFFWTVSPDGRLRTLLVTGMRGDRTGLAVVPLPEAPMAEARDWLAIDVRGDGTDFSNSMPGAELDGLYSFAASGEVLKLIARFFAYARAVPDALEPCDPPASGARGSGAGVSADAPEASVLPFVRVTLQG